MCEILPREGTSKGAERTALLGNPFCHQQHTVEVSTAAVRCGSTAVWQYSLFIGTACASFLHRLPERQRCLRGIVAQLLVLQSETLQ